MSFNQLSRYEQGYNKSGLNRGKIILGVNDLLTGKGYFVGGSTALCGVAVDPWGNIYASDAVKHIIIKTTPGGNVSTYAGKSGVPGNNGANIVDGYDARFNNPGGLACDRSGNLYVADVANNQIRKIDSRRRVSLLAGSPTGLAGLVDGINLSSKFNSPYDVDVDRTGNIWVADTKNHAVRIIHGGTVETVAGNGTAGDVIGRGKSARFNKPYSVACSSSGWVLVMDSENRKIKLIDSDSYVHHYSGSGLAGWFIGNAMTSKYMQLKYGVLNPSGDLYVIDYDKPPSVKSRLLRIDRNGAPHTVTSWTEANQYVVGVASAMNCEILYVVESVADEFESSSQTATTSSDSSTSISSRSTTSVSSLSSRVLTSTSNSSSLALSSASSSSSLGVTSTSNSSSLALSSRTWSSMGLSSRTWSSQSSNSSSSSSLGITSVSSRGKSSSSSLGRSSSSSSSSLGRSSSSSSSSLGRTSSSSSGVDIEIGPDEMVTLTPSGHYDITYTGDPGTTAYLEINGVNFQIANELGSFVWDADDAQSGRHVFTSIGEGIIRSAGVVTFRVVWNGFGSLVFKVRFTNPESSSSQSSQSTTSQSTTSQSTTSVSSQSTTSQSTTSQSTTSVSSQSTTSVSSQSTTSQSTISSISSSSSLGITSSSSLRITSDSPGG